MIQTQRVFYHVQIDARISLDRLKRDVITEKTKNLGNTPFS